MCHDLLDTEVAISLCGLGEPMLNRHAAEFVAQVRARVSTSRCRATARCSTRSVGQELIDAGLQQIYVNVGEEGEDYDEVYKLPFERTLENVVRFNEQAAGSCEVTVVLVDHRESPEHIEHMTQYWTERGIRHVHSYEIMNRGGSLFIDHMQYEEFDELARPRSPSRAASAPRCAVLRSSSCSSDMTASTTSAARTGRSRPPWGAFSTRRSWP